MIMVPALKIQNLYKKYGENEVISWLDLEIEDGDFFALLWHNGAGKTTTIWIITDLVLKTSGKVEIFGIDTDKDFKKAKQLIWVVPQEFNFSFWEKVKNIPVIQAGYYGIPKKEAQKRTEELLKILHLWDEREKESRELSGWMKRRLMIARALVHQPKLLILDEPTAGVDVELRKTMWEFIIELNNKWTTILLTTHYLEEVETLCNKVAIINKWKIIENTTTKELIKKLDEETFILDISNEKNISFPIEWGNIFKMNLISQNEMEITLWKNNTFNQLFDFLNTLWITVHSMKNKSNRIEQLFIRLTNVSK